MYNYKVIHAAAQCGGVQKEWMIEDRNGIERNVWTKLEELLKVKRSRSFEEKKYWEYITKCNWRTRERKRAKFAKRGVIVVIHHCCRIEKRNIYFTACQSLYCVLKCVQLSAGNAWLFWTWAPQKDTAGLTLNLPLPMKLTNYPN